MLSLHAKNDIKKVLGKLKKIRGIFGLWLWEDPQDSYQFSPLQLRYLLYSTNPRYTS